MSPASPLDDRLRALFRERFRDEPTLSVRAPGRVNLIGEHVDYVGLPVLPVALSRHVVLLLRPRDDDTVRIVNAEPDFGERSFRLEADPPPGPDGDWGNYLKAAARDRVRALGRLRGFDAVLGSDVPVAAGLSSSSALVVAVAVALEAVNDGATPPLELAETLARAERFVGTEGGGMDQAVCLGARAGHAALVRFEPLSIEQVAVPGGWRFVVAHSGVRAEKSGGARAAYNERRRSCFEALARVRKAMGVLEEAGYSELLARHSDEALFEVAAGALDPVSLRRFRHVVTEGRRVGRARTAMEEASLQAFGRLMDQGHASLRDDYEVSLPELDRLVEAAGKAGAAGARLTGAGFGGCVVALCRESEVERVLRGLGAVARHRSGGAAGGTPPPFIVEPGAGASVE